MPENCDVTAIFSFYGQFGTFWNPDSGRIVCKTKIFIKSNLLSYKKWKQNEKISNTALALLLWVRFYFGQKVLIFFKKMLT